MATIYPFQPYRYSDKAGALQDLATQPYDKISPEMRQRYLQASPYNLVRIISVSAMNRIPAATTSITRGTVPRGLDRARHPGA